jgi:hypothetical protein
VVSAVQNDPTVVAGALSGNLDYQHIQQQLDPDPADVEGEVQGVRDTLDNLCQDLGFAPAVANDITAC